METMFNPKSLWLVWIPAGSVCGVVAGTILGNLAVGVPMGIAGALMLAHILRSLNRTWTQ